MIDLIKQIVQPPNKSLQQMPGTRHALCLGQSHAGCIRAAKPRRYAASCVPQLRSLVFPFSSRCRALFHY